MFHLFFLRMSCGSVEEKFVDFLKNFWKFATVYFGEFIHPPQMSFHQSDNGTGWYIFLPILLDIQI